LLVTARPAKTAIPVFTAPVAMKRWPRGRRIGKVALGEKTRRVQNGSESFFTEAHRLPPI
jgi:hypothetical protein